MAVRRLSLKDNQLTARMLFTMFLLALVYVAFVSLLIWAGMPSFFVIGMAIVMVGFQYFLSDKLVLWSTGAKTVTPQQEPYLHGIVDRLIKSTGMPKPKVAIMETHVPNAFATGRSPKNAVVAVTRGILNRLNEKELEAVLAHELTHVKNRDVMVITWASLIVVAASFLLRTLFWSSLFGGFGGGGSKRDGNQAVLIMIAVMVGTFVVYMIAQLLILALSRYREYAADRGAAIITGAPAQLSAALTKISGDIARIPQKDLRDVSGANAFYIVSALKGESIAELFATHPPLKKRIERLEMLQRQLEGR